MAANYSHLIDIIFAAKNAGKTKKEIEDVFKTVKGGAKTAQVTTKKMGDLERALRRAAVVAPVWLLLRSAMMAVLNLIKEQIKFLVDFENAMARIKIVGRGTAEEYQHLGDSILALSIAYGVSASEGLEAAKIFAQQGKSISETITLTRAAMIGAQVLGKDVKVVVEDLTAAMKAFGISSNNVISVVDNLINVEKNFAVTSAELSAGIKRTGATANQVGVTMAELVGDITAVIEVTRQSGEAAARGLQFMYARLLTTAKPVIESLAGIKFYLDEQGRATSALTGTLRSATDILDELSLKWKTLTNEQRLNIATSLGSKRQLVVVNALMQNYGHAIDARIKALTSAGEAEKALAIVEDTVAFKTKALASSWNILTKAVADTSAWKGTLDWLSRFAVGLADVFDKGVGAQVKAGTVANKILAGIEVKQSQLNSVEELIKLRDKLLSQPIQDDDTKERVATINAALDDIGKDFTSLKINIDTSNLKEIKKSVLKLTDSLIVGKVDAEITFKYAKQLGIFEQDIKDAQDRIDKGKFDDKQNAKDALLIQDTQEKILQLRKQQTAEIEKQSKLAISKNLVEALADMEDLSEITGELTEKEKEQFEIQRKLNRFKIENANYTEQIIKKEIELVKASQNIYDAKQKNLKLETLHNQLLEARIKIREQEKQTLTDLTLEYEKASALERVRIRRLMELLHMTPAEIEREFKEGGADKDIIIENLDKFNQAIQDFVIATIARDEDLPRQHPDEVLADMFDKILQKIKPIEKIEPPTGDKFENQININNKVDSIINVAIHQAGVANEESIEIVAQHIKRMLKEDPEFKKGFLGDAGNYIKS